MRLIYQGKTKNVFENENGTLTLKLKDDATGKDGVFDPGENAVGLCIEGLGRESLRLSAYYFRLLKKIPNHYISSDIEKAEMTVKRAEFFGSGVEFICRLRADGSFLRRFGEYVEFGKKLPLIVEACLKDDERQDPPITKNILSALGIMTKSEYKECKNLTQKITKIIAKDLRKKGLELFDIKLEFGKYKGKIILIDEFSAGVMRVYKDGGKVKPMDLSVLILG